MKKARVLLAMVFTAVAVSLSGCADSITAYDCPPVDPGSNSRCE